MLGIKMSDDGARARSFAGMLLLSSLLGVSACSDGDEAAASPSTTAPAITKELPSSSMEAAAELAYTYAANDRRDPYKTYFDELQIDQSANGPATELQRYDLDQLKLVGVVVGTATPTAMAEDPTGRGHVVKIGTLIGKHLGQVKHIRRGEIVVEEAYRDFAGARHPQLKRLKLEESKVSSGS